MLSISVLAVILASLANCNGLVAPANVQSILSNNNQDTVKWSPGRFESLSRSFSVSIGKDFNSTTYIQSFMAAQFGSNSGKGESQLIYTVQRPDTSMPSLSMEDLLSQVPASGDDFAGKFSVNSKITTQSESSFVSNNNKYYSFFKSGLSDISCKIYSSEPSQPIPDISLKYKNLTFVGRKLAKLYEIVGQTGDSIFMTHLPLDHELRLKSKSSSSVSYVFMDAFNDEIPLAYFTVYNGDDGTAIYYSNIFDTWRQLTRQELRNYMQIPYELKATCVPA